MNLRLIAGLLLAVGLTWGALIAWLVSAIGVGGVAGVVALAVMVVLVREQSRALAAKARTRRQHMSPEWLAYMRGDRSPGSAE